MTVYFCLRIKHLQWAMAYARSFICIIWNLYYKLGEVEIYYHPHVANEEIVPLKA